MTFMTFLEVLDYCTAAVGDPFSATPPESPIEEEPGVLSFDDVLLASTDPYVPPEEPPELL